MDGLEAFQNVDMRVGRVVAVEAFPEARKPAYRLTIDFGALGLRHSSAQLTELYNSDNLAGRLVIGVISLPPRRIAGFVSEVLVLGLPDEHGRVTLISPDGDVPLGGRVY
jgi:tRNA-binding protein